MDFPGGSDGKNLPLMREIQFRSLGCEDPLGKETATHPSILSREFLVGYSPWGHKESDMTERLTHSLIPTIGQEPY